MSTKKEIMPLYANVIIRPYDKNPYIQNETSEGLILTDNHIDNPDTGEKSELERMIVCGQVVEKGPDCKFVKVGDDVFFNYLNVRPVPFMRQGFLISGEQNIIAIMADDLNERFSDGK